MAKKANVRKIELSPGKSQSGLPVDSPPVEMPVRRSYSDAERSSKSRKYFVSYCVDDGSEIAEEFRQALARFKTEKESKNDIVWTTKSDPRHAGDAKRSVVFLTDAYIDSPKCMKELARVLASVQFSQWIAIFKEVGMKRDALEKLRNLSSHRSDGADQSAALNDRLVDQIIEALEADTPKKLTWEVHIHPACPGSLSTAFSKLD